MRRGGKGEDGERGKGGYVGDSGCNPVIPAVVRTSVKPNRPAHTHSRYPLRVATANPAPVAATILLSTASTAAARKKAVIACSRNSQPIVGIVR